MLALLLRCYLTLKQSLKTQRRCQPAAGAAGHKLRLESYCEAQNDENRFNLFSFFLSFILFCVLGKLK